MHEADTAADTVTRSQFLHGDWGDIEGVVDEADAEMEPIAQSSEIGDAADAME